MKKWLIENMMLLLMLLGFLLYWIFGVVIAYITCIFVICFIAYLKISSKTELYNFDLVLFICYIIFSVFGLFILKDSTLYVLIVILGIIYVYSFYKNKRMTK